ncbi:MAG: alpha/beta hydrolase [Myxococcota bacterium]
MGNARRRVIGGAVFVLFVLGLSLGGLALATRDGEARPGEGTVVLLHGLGRSEANMKILEWRLEARGHRVCNVGYDTRVATIEAATDEVAAAMSRCGVGSGPVHFVTHSLGGLVLRALLPRHPGFRPGRAVMLAPPNHGSEIADRLRELDWLEPVMGPLAAQLGTRPEDLPRSLPVPSMPFGVIAGDDWINPAGPLWLPAPHDGTVSVASTRLEGMQDHLVLPYTHTFIVTAGPVAEQVDTFLRRGRFGGGE